MNKLQQIVNIKWFPFLFILICINISVFQHYRIFNLDFIGIHTWRQTQTQTVILNFAYEDFCIFNPHINEISINNGLYRMEFPLMQWLIAILYKMFGNHIIITRLFIFCVTFFSVLGIYKIANYLTSNKLYGFILAWLFLFSPIIYYYSVNPIPDNMALCLCIWSLYFWLKHLKSSKNSDLIICCICLSISIALKLPFIVFAGMYLSKFITTNPNLKINYKYFLIPFLFFLPPIIWYFLVIKTWHGNGIVAGIFENNISVMQFLDIFQFNLISTLPELLINYATLPFFLIGFYSVIKSINYKNNIHLSLLIVSILASIYFFYEINMIAKVHDYYLFPFMPLIFLIIIEGLIISISSRRNFLRILLLFTIIISPITAYLRCNERWNLYHPGTTKEYVIYKDKLQKAIPLNAKIIVENDDSNCINLYYLNRKGWNFSKNSLTKNLILDRMNVGATYICSDNNLELQEDVVNCLDSLIISITPIKIYKLKRP